MKMHLPSKRLVAVPLALMALTLTGCPDTSLNPPRDGGDGGDGGPVGRLKVVQTLVGAQDSKVSGVEDLVVGEGGEHVYVSGYAAGDLGTFDRRGTDGSLTRRYSDTTSSGVLLSMTPDGKHLYTGGRYDDVLQQVPLHELDLDATTGKPTLHAPDVVNGGTEMAIAASGRILYVAQLQSISSYLIDEASGVLTAGPDGSINSMLPVTLLADDSHGALFASRSPDPDIHLMRYAVDASSGALTQQAE